MSNQHEEELKRVFELAKEDDVLSLEELNATEGGHNIALGNCGDNYGNCVKGCSCELKEDTGKEMP